MSVVCRITSFEWDGHFFLAKMLGGRMVYKNSDSLMGPWLEASKALQRRDSYQGFKCALRRAKEALAA